jgi:hypothetical protein
VQVESAHGRRTRLLELDGELDAVRADGRELNVRRVDDHHLVVEITDDAYAPSWSSAPRSIRIR